MGHIIYYLTHVIDRFHRGWLEANLTNGDKIALSYLTRVNIFESNEKQEIVIPLEGKFANQKVVVSYFRKLGREKYSYFSKDRISLSKLVLKVNNKSKTLIVNGKVFPIVLSDNCKKGIYNVGFPIKRNILNMVYSNEESGGSRFYDTWFPLIKKHDFNLSRYLHYGLFSKGCITVKYNLNRDYGWSNLFLDILRSRVKNGYLATLVIN